VSSGLECRALQTWLPVLRVRRKVYVCVS